MAPTDSGRILTQFLASAKAPVSESDVTAGTGLDVGTVKSDLYDLMRRYECQLDVRGDGALVYDFGKTMRRLGKTTFGETMSRVALSLWRVFKAAYKASIAVVLVVYFVFLVVVIIGLAIAASAAAKDEGPAVSAFHLVGAIFRGIFEAFLISDAMSYRTTDRFGYSYRHREPQAPFLRRKPKEHEKSFISSVYDFVFGPSRTETDPLAQKREVAAFVRRRGGTLTIADVQGLSGLGREKAGKLFAAFVAELDGTTTITEEGALVAQFPSLLESHTLDHDEKIVLYWDEYVPPFELTGNTTGKNVLISVLAISNLSGAAVGSWILQDAFGAAAWIALGIVPACYFASFILLPLVRLPFVVFRNRKQHVENIRKRLYRVLLDPNQRQIPLADVPRLADEKRTSEETFAEKDMEPHMRAALRDLDGDILLSDEGTLVVDLSTTHRELSAAPTLALPAPSAEMVYSTRE